MGKVAREQDKHQHQHQHQQRAAATGRSACGRELFVLTASCTRASIASVSIRSVPDLHAMLQLCLALALRSPLFPCLCCLQTQKSELSSSTGRGKRSSYIVPRPRPRPRTQSSPSPPCIVPIHACPRNTTPKKQIHTHTRALSLSHTLSPLHTWSLPPPPPPSHPRLSNAPLAMSRTGTN